MPRAALIVVLAAAVLAACAAPTHIEGQRIRATAGSAEGLHAEGARLVHGVVGRLSAPCK